MHNVPGSVHAAALDMEWHHLTWNGNETFAALQAAARIKTRLH